MKSTIKGDLFGGLTAGVVALPLCLAFGIASGLGPAAGIYGGIFVGLIAALFGGTPIQITGPTAPMTLIASVIVVQNTLDGYVNLPNVVAVFLAAGAIQALFGVLRLGQYIRYLPYPVISGLMTGVGISIITQQIFPLIGSASPSSQPLQILLSLPSLPEVFQITPLLVGGATVAIIYGLPRIFTAIPASLVALVTLSVVATLLGLSIPTIGSFAGGLPQLIIPHFEWANASVILLAGAQLAFLGSIDSLATSLVADSLTKTQHNSNRELIGQGLGNMTAALFGGLPGAGAFMRTAINIKSGGKTRLSGVIHSLFLLGALLGLSSIIQFVPNAVLAGILITAGIGIIDYRVFNHFLQAPRADIIVMLVVVGLTIFSDLITAVAVGMVMAALIFMSKIATLSQKNTQISMASDDPWADALNIPTQYRSQIIFKHVQGPLFFGFAHSFKSLASGIADGKIVVIRLENIEYIDKSGLYALQDVVSDLRELNIRVCILGLHMHHIDQMVNMGIIPLSIPKECLFDSIDALQTALPDLLSQH